jgi:AraC-like DNA-binding protein
MLTELVHEDQLASILKKAYPSAALHPFIQYYRETTVDSENETIRFLPNVGFTIRFNLGSKFSLKNEKESFEFDDHILIPNNHTWIADGQFFAIKFRFGLLPYLNGRSHEGLVETPVPVGDLLSDDYIKAMEQSTSFEERVALTENYFLPLYEKNTKLIDKYRVIENMVNYFIQNNFSSFRIEEGTKNSFVSSKSLQRYFLKNFGLTPKTVYCILRVRKALEAYFSHSVDFRIYDFDYYDYSHFYKEIKRVVGVNLPQLKDNEGFRGIA